MSLFENKIIEQAFSLISKSNRLAKKKNRIVKKQIAQSKFDHQQAERLYFLEKSKIQPTFKLAVSEFLLTEPDFVNDPEHAMEADFLAQRGFLVDQRILRFKLSNNGRSQFMRPMFVAQNSQRDANNLGDSLLSMTAQVYFASVESIISDMHDNGSGCHEFNVYLIYRDQTTLPVVLSFKISQQLDSKLLRWEVEHVDTVFVGSRSQLKRLSNAAVCKQLFVDSYE